MAQFRLTGVPAALVDKRKKAYERDGAKVEAQAEDGGTFTLIITYPD